MAALGLAPILGCDRFLFIFLLLEDFSRAFLDLDLASEGLLYLLFLSLLRSRLVFICFLPELFAFLTGLRERLLDLLLFSFRLP